MTVIPFRPRPPERAYDPKGYTGPPAPGDCGAVCARSVDDLWSEETIIGAALRRRGLSLADMAPRIWNRQEDRE